MEIKIAVLLPRSDMFPTLGMDFLNGLRMPFREINEAYSPKFLIESIGNGADDELLQRVEKMILQENADALVLFSGFFMLEKIVAIANSYQKPVIHVSLGGRALKSMHKSPYVLYQSLNLTQSSYAAGKYAAENIGKKGALLCSFYDGGYHMTEGFVSGFTDHGGEMVYNYVSQLDYSQDDFRSMVDGLNATQPEVAFALFSYKEARRVMEVLNESGLDDLKIMALPLMVDESTAVGGINPQNIQSVASWAFDDNSIEMNSFKDDYEGSHSVMPNLFALLGNEVGTVLAGSLKSEGAIPKQIGAYMASKTIPSPRGELRYTELHESLPKAFKVRQLSVKDGKCHNNLVSGIDVRESELINKKMEELPNNGWKNPYICT